MNMEPQHEPIPVLEGPLPEGSADEAEERIDWLGKARKNYQDSTDWLDKNLRRQLERNLANFRGRHPKGSKYYSDAYKGRSRLFIPKTRSASTALEAAVAGAYFSTADVVDVSARDPNDPAQLFAADLYGELLNYRLQKSIPWFMVLVGAAQDAWNAMVCSAYIHWVYEEDRNGQVIKDQPAIDLIPIENLRVDPAANWLDPVHSSPYVVYLIPMTVEQVLERMERDANPRTGAPAWKSLDETAIRSAGKAEQENDSTRMEREGNRTGTYETRSETTNSTVWVHMNIIRHQGEDVVFWTLGTTHQLTDPVPLREVFHTGRRPFEVGVINLEAHMPYPAAPAELVQDMQTAINDITNQRFDNVQLVLNRRFKVRRGAEVDMRALQRSTPGGVVLTSDLNAVQELNTPDVTQSSYAEQDRMQLAFDEISGVFSNASVASNRQLNETVGGMEMLTNGANAIQEYRIRVFNETFVEPVLRQLMALEQEYETDVTVLRLAADKAELLDQWKSMQGIDLLLRQELDLTVNVGLGAVNPRQRVEKFMFGLNAVAPIAGPRVNADEVIKEVFGALGYKDGKRFFKAEEEMPPPQLPPELAEKIKLDSARLQQDGQIAIGRLQLDYQRFSFDAQTRIAELQGKREIEMAKAAAQENIALQDLQSRLGSDQWSREIKQLELALRDKEIDTKRQIAAIQARMATNELAFKARTGLPGI